MLKNQLAKILGLGSKNPFDILYEDDNIFIINKPSGIMVHADGRGEEVTIADLVRDNYPDLVGVGEDDRPGIVHRLDRDTTGVMVICKTDEAFRKMKNKFKAHQVRKVYRAIVEGNIKNDTGIIDTPIARAKSDFRKKSVVDPYSQDHRGEEREAVTKYKVLARSEDKKFTYIEVYPETGRTHQIRVHMRSIRHPIIGDDLYGSRGGKEVAPRTMLHAFRIEFTLRNKDIKVEAAIPKDMGACLDKLFKMC